MIDNWDYAYDENEEVTCRHCKWTGKMKDTKYRYVYSSPEAWASLAGREGYEYSCPRCGGLIQAHYTKMS